MTPASAFRHAPRGLERSVTASVLLALCVVLLLSWLHFAQREALQATARKLENLRQARIELAEGFLHASLGDAQGEPFSRGTGSALLRQAIQSFERELGAIGVRPGEAEAFRAGAERLRGLLARHERESTTPNTRVLVDLRIAYADLQRQSAGLDATMRRQLAALAARTDQRFALALAGSVGALGMITGILVLAGRRLRASLALRDQAEAAVHQSEERFRRLFQEAPLPLGLVGPGGEVLALSSRFEQVLGYGRADIRTLADWWRLAYPDEAYRRRVTADWQRAVAQAADGDGRVAGMEVRVTCKDGSRRTVVISAIALQDGILASFFDVTEIRQAECEIHRLNAGLERRVAERTAALSAANRELDAFSYAVSHDLRAPLRAMRGFSQALLDDHGGQFSADARGFLEQIELAGRHMSELVDGLLTLSRCSRGELRRDSVDLSALAGTVLGELARDEPGRLVSAEVAAGLTAHGDARMIEVVLRNLLGNAWKFTANCAAPRIGIFAETRGDATWTCVSDNGAGFDLGRAERLFQPFQRLHPQEEFPGLGIGLATVQRIVLRHGGRIEARAAPGRGATFCFTLPPAAATQAPT